MNALTPSLLAAVLLLGSGATTAAHEGQLDPGFGNGGRRIVSFDVGGGLDDAAVDTVIAPDGRIYLVGQAAAGGAAAYRVALTRLDPDGSVDTSYGQQGRVTWVEPDWFSMRAATALLQADGKLLVGGRVRKTAAFDESAFLCRFRDDGSVDTGFGDPATPGCRAYARGGWSAIAAAANGDLLLAGSERLDGDNKAIVARMDAQGVLIPGFGSGGRAVRGSDAQFSDVAEGSDARVIAIGISDTFSATPRALIAAFTEDGEPDFDFADSAGTLQLSAGTGMIAWGHAVAVAADGSYVMSGSIEVAAGGLRPMVLRVWPDGSAYPGFAPFGLRLYDPCAAPCGLRGKAIALGSDGRITVAGTYSDDGSSAATEMYALRLDPHGDPDPDFGDRDPARPGMSVIGFNLVDGHSFDSAEAVALHGERVLLGGYVASTKSDDDTDYAVVRLADGAALFADGFE